MKKNTTTPTGHSLLQIGSRYRIDDRVFRLRAIRGDMAALVETRTGNPVVVTLGHLRDAHRDGYAVMIDGAEKLTRHHSHDAANSFAHGRLEEKVRLERAILALRREVRQGALAGEGSFGVSHGHVAPDGQEPDPRAAWRHRLARRAVECAVPRTDAACQTWLQTEFGRNPCDLDFARPSPSSLRRWMAKLNQTGAV